MYFSVVKNSLTGQQCSKGLVLAVTCSTSIISDNEIPGSGSKGSLWDAGMLTAEGTVILDSMLETTTDKRQSCSLLRPNAETGASAGADACYRLELGISTLATDVVFLLGMILTIEIKRGNQLMW